MTERAPVKYEGLNEEAKLAQKESIDAFLQYIVTGGDKQVLVLLARVIDTQRFRWLTELLGAGDIRPGGLEYINGVMAGMGDISNLLAVLAAPASKPVERKQDADTEIQSLIRQASRPAV